MPRRAIHISISEELYAKILERAKIHSEAANKVFTLSEVVRHAVKEFLKTPPPRIYPREEL